MIKISCATLHYSTASFPSYIFNQLNKTKCYQNYNN